MSYTSAAWVAPSGALTFTAAPELDEVSGGIRGAHTVVFSGPDNSTGAVHAYDEVGGQPRLTRLTANAIGFSAFLLDHPSLTGASEYFVFRPTCSIGRLTLSSTGVPQLQSVSCSSPPNTMKAVAINRTGELVVANSETSGRATELFALGSTGARLIASSLSVVPIIDRTLDPPLLVGWASLTGTGAPSYACVDEQPRRCWSAPTNGILIDSRIEPGSPHPAVSMLFYDRSATTNRITIVRSLGPGELQPP